MSSISKLAWIELKLLVREPFTALFVFLFPVVVLLVLAGVFTGDDGGFLGYSPTNYYVAAYIGTVIAALSLIGIPVHVATYRERGILRRLVASSVTSYAWIAAQLIVGLVIAAVGALVLIATAVLIYDVQAPASALGIVLSFVVATLAFVSLGLLIGVIMPTARSAQGIGLGLFFPMWMLSGTGPPPDVMSDVMRTISSVLPMTWMVDAFQESWNGSGLDAWSLVILVVLLVVATSVTIVRVRPATESG